MDELEEQIRTLLAADMTSTEFSNRVFGQFHGLFARLGPTVAERKRIVQTELWKAAQARLRELERRDLARIRKTNPMPQTVAS